MQYIKTKQDIQSQFSRLL